MNCLYETIAGAYISARNRLVPPSDDEIGDAEENLEACRASMVSREVALESQVAKLAAAALARKAKGDTGGLRSVLVERKRLQARLEKVRNGVALLDKQLDALRASELDKELMNSLKLSSQAMKKAGIGQGIEEAESVMNELDDQIREASELTTVLATPLVNSTGEEEDELDLEEELGLIEKETAAVAAAASGEVPEVPRPVSAMREVEPQVPAARPAARLSHLADL